MPTLARAPLEPRKSPIQARSIASVDAILAATIQVLRSIGKDRLTTTRVALRAGVSVGTLYQYFPNKSALLRSALQRHLDRLADTVEVHCRQQHGAPLDLMAATLVNAFLQGKLHDVRTSAALYAVSSDVDGARISRQIGLRIRKSVIAMLASSPTPLHRDPDLIATMLLGLLTGVSRQLLESPSPEKHSSHLRLELTFCASIYLQACALAPLSPPTSAPPA